MAYLQMSPFPKVVKVVDCLPTGSCFSHLGTNGVLELHVAQDWAIGHYACNPNLHLGWTKPYHKSCAELGVSKTAVSHFCPSIGDVRSDIR